MNALAKISIEMGNDGVIEMLKDYFEGLKADFKDFKKEIKGEVKEIRGEVDSLRLAQKTTSTKLAIYGSIAVFVATIIVSLTKEMILK